MTDMKHVFRDHNGDLVGPGDYDITGTVVRIGRVSKSNGLTIDRQDAVIVHTVEPKATHIDETATVEDETGESRVEVLERALADIRTAFDACFTGDFGGYDWRGDEAIQAFARTCSPILNRTSPTTVVTP